MSVRKLSKELQELAIKELNEDPKRVPEDLAYIKSWISKQDYLTARTGEFKILNSVLVFIIFSRRPISSEFLKRMQIQLRKNKRKTRHALYI